MAQEIKAYRANDGSFHTTKQSADRADFQAALSAYFRTAHTWETCMSTILDDPAELHRILGDYLSKRDLR